MSDISSDDEFPLSLSTGQVCPLGGSNTLSVIFYRFLSATAAGM